MNGILPRMDATTPNHYKNRTIQTKPWESKDALLRQQTQWLHTTVLTLHNASILLTWLDTSEGPARLTLDLPGPPSATTILTCYLQLESKLRILH